MLIRSSTTRFLGSAVAVATLLVALVAVTAWAHPSWDPREVPTGGPVEVGLVIPHGCADGGGEPAEGEESSPTTEVAIPITDTFGVRPQLVDGYEVQVVDDVASWVADDGGRPAELVLPAVLEIRGAVGDVVPVPVYQECANGEFYRWAAGDGEEGDPAVTLTIIAGDPDPLPSESRVPLPGDTLPSTPSPTPTAAGSPTAASSTERPPIASPSPTPSPSASPTALPESTTTPVAIDEATSDDDDGFNWLLVGLGLAVAVAVVVSVVARRSGSRPGSDAGGDGPT